MALKGSTEEAQFIDVTKALSAEGRTGRGLATKAHGDAK